MSAQHQFEDPNEAIKAWDLDGDGQITAMEMAVAHDKQIDLEGKTTNMKKMVCVVVTLCLVVIGTMLAVTVLANELSKESRPSSDAVLEDLKGNIVNTQSYEADDMPLGAGLLALELEDLNKLNAVQVTDVDAVDYSLNIAGFVRHSPEHLDLLTTHRIYHTVRINAGRLTVLATQADGSDRSIQMMTEELEEEEIAIGRRLLGNDDDDDDDAKDRRKHRRHRHRCGFRGRPRRRRNHRRWWFRTPKFARVALCRKTGNGFRKIVVADLGNKIDRHLARGDVFPGTEGVDSNCVEALVAIDCIHAYGEFSTCSATCGGGSQTRSVSTTAAANGGVCSTAITTQFCAQESCPVQPVDCQGSWSAYSSCSETCGTGTQSRTWTTTTEPSGGGAACPEVQEQSRDCQNTMCAPETCPQGTCMGIGDTCNSGVCDDPCAPQYDGSCCFQTASGWFNDC